MRAIALELLISFFGSESGFRKNTKSTVFQELGDSSCSKRRAWKHFVDHKSSRQSCLIISVTIEFSGTLTLSSATSTSTVISAILFRPLCHACHPRPMIISSCFSVVSSSSPFCSSQGLCSSSVRTALSSVNVPSTYSSVGGLFLSTSFFPDLRLHLTASLARACLACTRKTFLSIGLLFMAAALSRVITYSGIFLFGIMCHRHCGEVDRLRRTLYLLLVFIEAIPVFVPSPSQSSQALSCLRR